MEIEALLEQYFDTSEDYEPKTEQSLCAVSYCNSSANETGFCEKHYDYQQQGLTFRSQYEENRHFYKSITHKCKCEWCKVDIPVEETYCPVHQKQVDKFGTPTTEIDGSHVTYIYKHYALMRVFDRKEKEFMEIKFDHEDINRFKHSKIRKNKYGDLVEVVKEGEVYKENLIKLLLTKENKSDMILMSVNNDKLDLKKDNWVFIDRKSHFFLTFGGSPGKSGYRGIRRVKANPKKKIKGRWLLTLFYDRPDLKITRHFVKVCDAVMFRNAIYNAYYHPRMAEMVHWYHEPDKKCPWEIEYKKEAE